MPQKLGSVRLRFNGLILTDDQEQGLQAGGGVHSEPPQDRQGATAAGPGPAPSFRRAFFDFSAPPPPLPEASGSGLAPEVPGTALNDRSE